MFNGASGHPAETVLTNIPEHDPADVEILTAAADEVEVQRLMKGWHSHERKQNGLDWCRQRALG